jgi:hypothetical protein
VIVLRAEHLGRAVHELCAEEDIRVVEHAFFETDNDELKTARLEMDFERGKLQGILNWNLKN